MLHSDVHVKDLDLKMTVLLEYILAVQIIMVSVLLESILIFR